MVPWLLVTHVFGFTFWIGGLLMTAAAVSQYSKEDSAEGREALIRAARRSLRGMADPGALIAIIAGVSLILTNRSYYLHAPWLHIKLTFVVILLGLHGYVGVKSKRLATGGTQPGQSSWLFIIILLVFLSILIATLPGSVYLT